MTAPAASTRRRLAKTLSDPVTKEEAAAVLGIGRAAVYDSCRRFDAARIAGDEAAKRREIPCIHLGGVRQADGTYKGGRYIIPLDAFTDWYVSVGMGSERLYGEAS